MAWVRLDDGFWQHPKMVLAGPLARDLQVAGLCYANRYLTDGFLSESAVLSLARYDDLFIASPHTLDGMPAPVTADLLAETLIAVGSWERTEGGYLVHDYTHFQPTKAEVLSDRKADRERKRRNRGRVDVREVAAQMSEDSRSLVVSNGNVRPDSGSGEEEKEQNYPELDARARAEEVA